MDLTKLMKGPTEAEPVQEQPKLSREEYAAQKKAEREELWTRIDALTADVFKDGSSLRGFLDFTAQCSPERIENLLLFHSDAPEATWLKTFDEWKQAGRSVRGGEAGYTALIGQDYTREDGTAASGYYVGKKFDVSQTRGRQPDRAPVYAADELVTAVFTNSPVRLAVSEAVPEGIHRRSMQPKTVPSMCATIWTRRPRSLPLRGNRRRPAMTSMTAVSAVRHTVRRATARRMWPQRNTVWTSVPFPLTVCAKCAPVWSRRSRGAF